MARGKTTRGEPSTPTRRSTRGKAPMQQPKDFWSPSRDDTGKMIDFEEIYEILLKRTQVPGRWLDFNKFDYRDFQTKLVVMGWDDFLSMTIKGIWYPRVVAQFYANLKPIDDSSFITLVKGTSVVVNKQLLIDLFLIPGDGLNILGLTADEVENPPRYDLVFKDHASYFSKDLLEEARMIHKVVCANLITKKGNFDRVTEDALVVIYCFMREIKIDLASLIFYRMINGSTYSSLPYGLMITRILEYFEVDLSDEVPKSVGPPFNDRSLKLMNIHVTEIQAEEEEEGEAGPSIPRVSSPNVILEEIRKIKKTQRRMKKQQGILMRTVKGLGKLVKKVIKNQGEIMTSLGCGHVIVTPPPSPLPHVSPSESGSHVSASD